MIRLRASSVFFVASIVCIPTPMPKKPQEEPKWSLSSPHLSSYTPTSRTLPIQQPISLGIHRSGCSRDGLFLTEQPVSPTESYDLFSSELTLENMIRQEERLREELERLPGV